MCLLLYAGSPQSLPLQSTPDLGVEPLDEAAAAIAQWFSQPAVQFITSGHTCSCDFPHVLSETPVEYFEGLWSSGGERADELRSVTALLALLRDAVAPGGTVELYPVWSGDEALPPKGVISWVLADLKPDKFVFTERFMHVVHANTEAV